MRYTAVQEVYLTIGDLVLPKPLGLLNLVFLLYGRKITYTKKLRQPINGKLKSRYDNIRLYDPLFSKQLSSTISQQLHDCGNDWKRRWKLLNQFSCFVKPLKQVTSIVQDGLCIKDASGIANAFSEHFSSASSDNSSSLYTCAIPCYPHFFLYISCCPSRSALGYQLRATGPGSDNMNHAVIKLISPLIAPVLSHIFNLVFKTGVFPQQLKEAKVLPVCKKMWL